MPLPDLSPLEALSTETLLRLRARLQAIELSPGRIDAVVRAASAVHPLLRRPVLSYHLRRIHEPYAYAARALMFGDAVTPAELELALGDLTAPLRDSGLVVEHSGGLVSQLCLTAIDDLFVLTDDLAHGGDAVMGLGPLTIPLCAAARPGKRLGRALDLGCGAGTLALLVSRVADVVIATDINQRALALTRLNARLNGIENVETREGSLFEPVKGERFDLIASQPPFIPQSEAGKTGDFMQGGQRGDELMLKLINGLPPHLTHRGRGIVISEWGHGPKMPAPPERVRSALADASADVLVFQYPATSVDAHAIEYAAALFPTLGAPFESEALLRREHCAAMGIELMVPTLTVVRRIDDRQTRFEVIASSAIGRANASRIDELLLARDVVATLDSLLAAKVRMVEGVTLREEQAGPGAGVESKLIAILPNAAMNDPMPLTTELLRLATCVHEAPSVRAGITLYGEQYGGDEHPNQLAKNVAHALLGGLLAVR